MILFSQFISSTLDVLYFIMLAILVWFIIKYLRVLIETERVKQKVYKANLKRLKEPTTQIQEPTYMDAPFDDTLGNLLTNLTKQE